MSFEAREEWVQLCRTWETDKENYYWLYPKVLCPFRDKKLKILEVGVHHGGSLLLFDDYFHDVEIYGLDIDTTKCKEGKWKEDIERNSRIKLLKGNQSDIGVLHDLQKQFGPFDIIIDDGSHFVEDIVSTFEFFKSKFNLLYIIEDTCLTLTGSHYEITGDHNIEWMKDLCHNNNTSLIQDRYFYERYWAEQIRHLDENRSPLYSIRFFGNAICIERT